MRTEVRKSIEFSLYLKKYIYLCKNNKCLAFSSYAQLYSNF